MAMVWNVKFDWLGNLFIGFSQRLKYRNTGRHDGHWWHLCEGVHPVNCIFMFKLATSNNFVLLLDWQDSISIKCCNAWLTLYM